ncbi:MAG: hypothetical protein ACOYD0_00780 [Candidatus Nanopelagicales bacterium]
MSDQQPPQDPQEPPAGQQPPYGQPPQYGQQPGFQPLPPSSPPPVGGAPAPQGSYAYNPGYGGGVPQVPMPQTNNNALVGFVLALVSWFVCPIVAAIVALVFASKGGKEIAASNGWQTGAGFVTAAKIIAWINIVVFILFGIVYAIIIIVVIANPDVVPSPSPWATFQTG